MALGSILGKSTTTWSNSEILSSETAGLFGLGSDAAPEQIFNVLADATLYKPAEVITGINPDSWNLSNSFGNAFVNIAASNKCIIAVVMSGTNYTNYAVYRTTNGSSWNQITTFTASTSNNNSVGIAFLNNTFVICSANGEDCWYSQNDGLSWQEGQSLSVLQGNYPGFLVATDNEFIRLVPNTTSNMLCYYSTNGITWNLRSTAALDPGEISQLDWCNGNLVASKGKFYSYLGYYYSTNNGSTWTNNNSTSSGVGVNMIYANGAYYSVSVNGFQGKLLTCSNIGNNIQTTDPILSFGNGSTYPYNLTLYYYDHYLFATGIPNTNAIKYIDLLQSPLTVTTISLADINPNYNNANLWRSRAVTFNGCVYLVVGNSIVYCDVYSQTQETFTTVAGNVISLPYCRIATGSYTGTGTYGSSNPNTLTFDFEPKIVFIIGSDGDSEMTVTNSCTGAGARNTANWFVNTVTWLGKTIEWYNSSTGTTVSSKQLNALNQVYQYIALG